MFIAAAVNCVQGSRFARCIGPGYVRVMGKRRSLPLTSIDRRPVIDLLLCCTADGRWSVVMRSAAAASSLFVPPPLTT